MKNILSKFSIIVILIIFFLNQASIVRAETILFEDDFSSGFEKWQSVRDNFDMWSIVDEQASAYVDVGSTLAELVPKDLYWDSEWKNIIYELDYKYVDGIDKNISFGFKDIKNWYEIHFVGATYFLSHVKNGRVVWDHTGIGTPQSGVFSHIKIELNEGKIVVFIDEEKVIDVLDPTFDNDYGKIGLKAGTGSVYPTHAIYDNIVVKSLDIADRLGIVTLKQSDTLWSDEEYDSARDWANEEELPEEDQNIYIEDWGCLITSIAMIMNFNGIDQMPNGDAVNPSSLNSWLNSQDDGYIGGGLVNWSAISRLSRLINEEYSTPKFEYQRVGGESLETAKNQIELSNPVILQIPGHFLVSDGIVDDSELDEGDLYINDPAYNYEKFSEHDENLVSTRILEPTFTDLSFLHISSNSNINVSISKEDGTEIDRLQTYEEFLSDFTADGDLESGGSSQAIAPSMKISEIRKPESGSYILEISQESFGPVKFNIFSYNKNGDLTNLSYYGLVGKNKLKFKINYDNEGNSSIEKYIDFSTLINDINELYDAGEIRKHYTAIELEKMAKFGQQGQVAAYPRYKNALEQLIDWYAEKISGNGRDYLKQRLSEI